MEFADYLKEYPHYPRFAFLVFDIKAIPFEADLYEADEVINLPIDMDETLPILGMDQPCIVHDEYVVAFEHWVYGLVEEGLWILRGRVLGPDGYRREDATLGVRLRSILDLNNEETEAWSGADQHR